MYTRPAIAARQITRRRIGKNVQSSAGMITTNEQCRLLVDLEFVLFSNMLVADVNIQPHLPSGFVTAGARARRTRLRCFYIVIPWKEQGTKFV